MRFPPDSRGYQEKGDRRPHRGGKFLLPIKEISP